MKSLKQNATYIEKVTEQETGEHDWLGFNGTTLSYKPDNARVKNTSTKDVLVYDNDDVTSKEIKLELATVVNNGRDLTNITPVTSMVASDGEVGDEFGMAVAVTPNGLVAIVGAWFNDTAGTDAGKVYTYKRASLDDTWTEVSQLTASDAEASDLFSYSVDISEDGLVAMVGSIREDTAATDAGKVYTYKRATVDDAWTEVSQLTASDAASGDAFGSSVSIASDGLVAIVGAWHSDTADTNAGKVYTYKRATIDDAWTEVSQLTASDAASGDGFGRFVTITSDGLVAMVGAVYNDTAATNAGKVYTYKRATVDDAWTEVSQLTASDAKDNDQFGHGCSISSDGLTALVGTWGPSKLYVYKRATIDDAWTEVNIIHGSYNLGADTAIASDAGVILIGANYYNNRMGTVYEYKIQDRLDIQPNTNELVPYKIDASKVVEKGLDLTSINEVNRLTASDANVNYIPKGGIIDFQLVESGTVLKSSIDEIDQAYKDQGYELFCPHDIYEYDRARKYLVSIGKPTAMGPLGIYYPSDGPNKDGNGTQGWMEHIPLNSDGLGANGWKVKDGSLTWWASNKTDVNQPDGNYYANTYLNITYDSNGNITHYDDNNGNAEYDTYLLVKRANTTMLNPDGSNDYYGSGAAVTSDGLVSMVGASFKDTQKGFDAGKVYTYKRDDIYSPWEEVNTLELEDARNDDRFGQDIVITDDGLYAAISAYRRGLPNKVRAGVLYMFKRSSITDTWTKVGELIASDARAGDIFGHRLSMTPDGLNLIVGSRNISGTVGINAGKVYTYKRATIDDEWTEVSQLTASDAEIYDSFGISVAISEDGLVAMVGASYEDTAGTNAGKVYTYKRATIDDAWTEVSQLTASDAEAKDGFGIGVAIYSDGLKAMVGAWGSDTADLDAGKVYLYKRATIDDPWIEVNQLTASDAEAYDKYGHKVAIAPKGTTLLVGAYNKTTSAGSGAGTVYTYNIDKEHVLDITDGGFTKTPIDGYIDADVLVSVTAEDNANAMLTLPNEMASFSNTDATNKTVIIDKPVFKNGTVIINGKEYNCDDVVSNGDGTFKVTLNSYDFTKDIKYVLVKGNITLPVNSSTTTSISTGIEATVVNTNDHIFVDGNEVIVEGKTDNGYTTVDLVESNQLIGNGIVAGYEFGRSVALSSNGLVAMVGVRYDNSAAPKAGKVYTYKRDSIDDNWIEVNQLTASDAGEESQFGSSITISPDGLIAMIGAYGESTIAKYAGKVYTYKRATIDDDWLEVSKLTASDAEEGDYFGASVAISIDGLVAMIGAYREDTAGTDAGKVYTYKRATIDDEWTEVNQLTASDAEEGDWLGVSVTMDANGLVASVGAHKESTAANKAGKVYTYKRDSIDDNWTEVNQLTASDAIVGGNFGSSLAMTPDGLVMLVGSQEGDSVYINGRDYPGKIYVFKRASIDDDWIEISQLTASDATNGDQYGISIAISLDGQIAMVGAYTADNKAGKVYTYKTNLQKDIVLTIPEQSTAPTSAIVLDKSNLLDIKSSVYNNGVVSNTYGDFSKQSRAVQRKIVSVGRQVEVTSNLTTNITKIQ